MKYLCLIYEAESLYERMSEQDTHDMMAEYTSFTESYMASGHVLGGEALQLSTTATTVRVRNGKISTTDGPFAETKEQLGGYYLIEGKDLNEAIQIVAKIPGARSGCVEIRPVMDFSAGDPGASPANG